MSHVITYEHLKSNLATVFEQLTQNEEPVVIVRDGTPAALLTPVPASQARRMTLEELQEELLKAEGRMDAGHYLEWEDVKRRLTDRLTEEAYAHG